MSATFKRSAGTAGIRGQLYETKLISLILYRAKHDDSIEQFQLASNMDSKEVGAFDDICFKAKVSGLSKPLIAFIQSKHKDDSEDSPKVVLMKYFLSYLKIREQFKSQDDPSSMFHGEFQDTECYFVIYTNGKEQHSLDDDAVKDEDDLAKLNELIATGGIAKRPYKHKADVAASLYEKLAKDKTISLAKRIATFMGNEMSFQDIVSDKNNIILLYHVFLVQKVFDVSEIKPEGHRVATFWQDFFDTRDEYLTLFKHTLFQEILNKRTLESNEINNLLSEFIAEPTDVTKLSNLIGTVVKYNNGQLELVEKYSKYFNQQLLHVLNCRSTINEAVELAAKDIVTKVPAAFGNKDLTLRGSDTKKERRIKHIKSKIIDMLDKSKPNNVIVMDESIEEGLLELNGGLAGAIGNIFVPDDNTKYMKITDSCESLGPLAKSLYTKLVNEIHNLHEYKFYFIGKEFPKFSLGPSDDKKSLVRDFLNNFLFYNKQANENKVEKILKIKIEDCQLGHRNYFQAKTDAMCLQYHDRIQKWWMLPHQAPYLTKDSNIFEEAINSIIKDPLMSSINLIYMSKIQHFEYTFHEDAVSSWHLQDHSTTVIITENCVLTVVKVLQHFKNHAVLDLEYIVKLPINDRNALCAELKTTNDHKALVFVCGKLQNKSEESKTLKIIGKTVRNKKTIIITNHMTHETLQKYFPKAVSIVQDNKNSLTDMSEASQKSILESTVVFQGVKLKLNIILDDESKAYVNGDVLNTIVSKETITISKLTVDRQYDEVKHLYVDRCVQKTNFIAETSLLLKTLFEIENDVVLVTAEPGMGKSTLLTHLSLETKIKHPNVWIVRVNLLEYSREFSKWKQENTDIDKLETIRFMCQVMLGEKQDGKRNNVEFELEENKGVVNLTQCTGDQWTEFELKLFLHVYNKGKIIFVFDGFDEIYPHYKDEVIKCIETVIGHNKKPKVWVTSRPYPEIIKCLQQVFGEPYKIKHLSDPAKKEYLMKIWKSHLILKELGELQLKNIHEFIHFMAKSEEQDLQACQSLLEIYMDAADYIINEIKTNARLSTCNHNYDDMDFKAAPKNILKPSAYGYKSDNNPLNIFLRAHFFINRIKDVSQSTNTWNRDENMFTFYEQYLEMILKRRFEGKNKMDINYPENKKAYERELVEFKTNHKKMAAYAIFNQHINQLFSKKDVKEMKVTIEFIEKGEEKTGLICSVANKIPVFIHTTFAEYFAVEYICDLLKHGNGSKKKRKEQNQHQLIIFTFDVMISEFNPQNLRTIFDNKIKIDEKLMSVIENHEEVIFNLFFEQVEAFTGNCCYACRLEEPRRTHFWPLFEALKEHLVNLRSLFVRIFEKYINKNNLSTFLEFVLGKALLSDAVLYNWDDLVVCVINKIKNYDVSRLNYVLRKNFGHLYRSRNYVEISSEEIIKLIRKDYSEKYNNFIADGRFVSRDDFYKLSDGSYV